VQGDHAALRRLLNTLLENAWRYTPSGKSVALTVKEVGEHLELAVEDTGIGIATQDQSRVFQRFFRAAAPLHGSHAGSGLGLSLALWIAECHGTSLTLDSCVGSGTRFSLRLRSVVTSYDEELKQADLLEIPLSLAADYRI
jgi:two-component system sensor histidine kinase SenX3